MSYTPTATADTLALTNATYQAINAGSATQNLDVIEIYIGGQATSSAVNVMNFSRSSTIGIIPTALAAPNSDGFMYGSSAPVTTVPVCFVAAGTGPLRAATATLPRLNLTHNAFGGIVRWVAAPGEEWTIIGQAASTGESILSCGPTTGNVGLIGSHIVYELK
jgi:hypothetical protein